MQEYQSILFPYAYNILGSAEDAKDAIQEVMLKYNTRQVIPENEKNYLIRGVINQSINLKKGKRTIPDQENPLPEPIAAERSDLALELKELVSHSLLFLLERLNPRERAVFILKEAFSYSHQEIAEVLSITVENSRKLLSRAHLRVGRQASEKLEPPEVLRAYDKIDRFSAAIREKDLDTLHQLLAEDIDYHADGGKKVKVVSRYTHGAREVAELLIYTFHKYQRNYTSKPAMINHQPGVLHYYRDQLILCQVFNFDQQGKIKSLNIILDPEKLDHLR